MQIHILMMEKKYAAPCCIIIVFLSMVCQNPGLRPKKLEFLYNLIKLGGSKKIAPRSRLNPRGISSGYRICASGGGNTMDSAERGV